MEQEEYYEVRESKFGKGLFARINLPPGTIICEAKGKLLTYEETVQLGEKESHTLQIDQNVYIYCQPPFLYSNHSCNPNCGVNANLELFALKKIKKGDELFWDYSTSMLERHWQMECLCGEKNCRKLITDFDLLPQNIQYKYLQLNIVFPFIVRVLQQRLGKTA